MPLFQVKSKIISNEKVCPGIHRMMIDAPQIASSSYAGQFVMIRVRNEPFPLLRRPFSFHTIGTGTEPRSFEILYKIVGTGTKILSQKSRGETLDVLGPLGRGFRLPPADSRRIWFIAGGMGIAPLFALADMLRQSRRPLILELFYGAGTADELVDLSFLEERDVRIRVCTDDGTCGETGFVTRQSERECSLGNFPDYFYSCGPTAMQRNILRWARAYGIRGQISMETMMACGVGACLGCSVAGLELAQKVGRPFQTYQRVCMEGPVFEVGGDW